MLAAETRTPWENEGHRMNAMTGEEAHFIVRQL